MVDRTKISSGQFVVVEGDILPTLEFDCSDWSPDVPAEKRTRGQFMVVTSEIQPTLEFDCSHWHDAIDARLSLILEAAPTGDALNNGIAMLQLVDSVNRYDRKLGGVGMNLVSSNRNNGTLTLLFASVDPRGARERIHRIIEAINGATEISKPPAVISLVARSA